MALSDWSQYGDTSSIKQDTTQVYSGSYSLLMQDSSGDFTIVYGQSETDNPTECIIDTWHYQDGNNRVGLGVARFQDINNYYYVRLIVSSSEINLGSVNSGNDNQVDSYNTNFYSTSAWYRTRLEFYEDGGVFYCEISAMKDGDSSFTNISTLSDSSNKHSGGGAVGMGISDSREDIWFDETEVYY